MPNTVLTKWRSLIARTTVLAVLASMLVIGAAPAGAAVDTSATCPSTIPSAGFTDLAGLDAKAQKAIDCLKFYGISSGTSATTFSPNTGVARWQMAIFLIREAEDHGIVLPSGADQGFTDIASLDAVAQKAINQVKQLGVTAGTSATTFSPNDIVPRWQMAIFLVRLAEKAGVTLPSGASQGFTDIAGLSAAAQTAINQAKQLGITDGTSATTFGPTANVLRWQMALFIVANMAVDKVLPTGLGFVVTAFDTATDEITYFDGSTTKKVVYAPTDTFAVDGVASSYLAFEASLSAGDLVTWTGTAPKAFSLTNKIASGNLVDDVKFGGTTLDLVDPATDTILINDRNWTAGTVQYKVDGVSVVATQFAADVSVGDTLSITGTGSVSNPYVFDLTNKETAGVVVGANLPAAGDFSIRTAAGATLGVVNAGGDDAIADVLKVGGSTATEVAFEAALSSGDTVTYARKNGVQTISLVNGAPPAVTGRVLTFDNGAANTISLAVGSSTVPVPNYGGFDLYVDGVSVVEANVDSALSIGDTVKYTPDDPDTVADESKLEVTTGAASGIPGALVTGGAGTVTIKFTSTGPATAPISTVTPNPALTGITGTSTVVYRANGTAVVQGVFEANVANIIAGLTTGTVSVTKEGTSTVWTVTTP